MTNINLTERQGAAANSSEPIEENFDLAGLMLDYLHNWKAFVISLIICLGAAFLYIHTVVPTFRIGASIYLNDDNITQTSAVALSADNPLIDMKNMIDETELEILKSRNSLLKIVDTLQLSYSYYNEGSWHDSPLYRDNPVVASMDTAMLRTLTDPLRLEVSKLENGGVDVNIRCGKDYEASAKLDRLPGTISTPVGDVRLASNGEYFDLMDKDLIIKIVNPAKAAEAVAANLDVQFAKNASTIVNFEYITPLPSLGNDVLSMIIYFYNRQIIEDKNRSAIQTEEFIQARLKDIQNELKDVEENLREYRERHNIIDQTAQISIDLNQQRATQTSITDLLTRERLINELMTEVSSMQISAARMDMSPLPTGMVDNAAINSAIDQFNRNVDIYNNFRSSMTAENEQITKQVTKLIDQKQNILRSLEAAKRQLMEQRKTMSAIENRSQSQLAAQPTVDQGLQEIFRDQSVKANIYTFLLQKREEIALQKTLATPTAQFIDDPSVMNQVAPRSVIIYFIGFIIGLLIPALWIYMKCKFFPKFKDKDDLTRITSVPIVGEICHADNMESEVVVGDNVSTTVAELFRLLRNNINFARTGGEKKVILVTSAISGEGKTFIALNLALTYALANKKVVVLGFDIRRPVLARKLGLSNRTGLTSYLSDQIDDLNEIIVPSGLNPNLYIIPAGPLPPNPNELLLSDRMDSLFATLRQEFDYVIVDTAPIGLVSDSFLIIPHSDVQLFVTRASYSSRRGIQLLHEAINSGQMEKPYIILNGVNMKSRAYHYRRYGYYYGGGAHTYGYKDGKKKK